MCRVALDVGFNSNTFVTGERVLAVARVRDQDKRVTKSHAAPGMGFTVWTTIWMTLNLLKTNNWRREWDSNPR